MQKNILRKVLLIGIIALFIRAIALPSISGNIQKSNIDIKIEDSILNKKSKFPSGLDIINWQWAKSAGGPYEDHGNAIDVDANGNTYITGYFHGPATFGGINLTSQGNDVFVAKQNSNGVFLWAASGGGPYQDSGRSVVVDGSGNVYITGMFTHTATFGSTTLTSLGNYDVFVAKLNNDGVWQWAKSVVGTGDDEGVWGVAVDGNGNTYITGCYNGTATFGAINLTDQGHTDVFVAKLDTNGGWQWAVSAGGYMDDGGADVAVDENGNTYITGDFYGTATFGSTILTSPGGGWDPFIAKLNSGGDWLWAVNPIGTGGGWGMGVALDGNGYTYITGTYVGNLTFGSTALASQGESMDVYIAKLNSAGVWQWAKSGGGTNEDRGHAIDVDANGSNYITGLFYGTATFGSTTLTSQGQSDVYVAKLDTNGVWQWAKKAGGTLYDEGNGVAVDGNGNTYITGFYSNAATFGSITLTSYGYIDIFIAKLSNNNPPNTPSNPSPSDGATNVNVNTQLGWTCSDPDGDSITYDVYFGTNSNPPLVSSNQYQNYYDPPGTLNFSTQYNWKIVAKDGYGGNTTGPVWDFTTRTNNPPSIPTDPDPSDGETDVDVNAILSWTCSDPDGDSLTYDVYFGTITNPPLVSSNQSENYYDPPGAMQYNTNYYWKIIAWDPNNTSNTSIIWDFTTGNEPNNPPSIPIIYRDNDSIYIYSIDPENDDIYYFIDWDDGTTSGWLGPCTSGAHIEISHEWSEPGIYNITAKAKDTHGAESSWSEPFTVVVENQPPNKPNKPAGETKGKINVEYTYSSSTTDTDGDQIYYWFDWGDETNSGWVGPYDSGELVTAKHTWTVKGTFQIKVKAKDVHNYESAWSDSLSVTMPRVKFYNLLVLKFLERFSNLNPILRLLFGL